MSIVWIYLISRVRPAGRPSALLDSILHFDASLIEVDLGSMLQECEKAQ